MGFVVIILHPYDDIQHNWFWQNIHTGECQQNIVFLNFKYLQKYFVAKSAFVKALELVILIKVGSLSKNLNEWKWILKQFH